MRIAANVAPGEEIRFALDSFPKRLEAGLPLRYEATVHYQDHDRHDLPVDRCMLDLSPYRRRCGPRRVCMRWPSNLRRSAKPSRGSGCGRATGPSAEVSVAGGNRAPDASSTGAPIDQFVTVGPPGEDIASWIGPVTVDFPAIDRLLESF